MDPENWLSAIGNAGRLFIESIPDAFWLAYSWAKDWQGLLGGMFLLVAAWIFSRGSLRAARIRAAAMVRSAEIAAKLPPAVDMSFSPAKMAARAQPVPSQPISPETELRQRVEQLRSLIRSAM